MEVEWGQMGERRGFQRVSLGLNLQTWARSRVNLGGRYWASWAVSGDGVVS
jgi:hypothetical protein